jgi:ElaB/YqjD/DUF883 family membrane-anchored ribosome-binding protein
MDYATPNPNALKDEEEEISNVNGGRVTDLRNSAAAKARVAAQGVQNRATQLKNAASEKATQLRSYAGEKATALKEDASQRATVVKQAASEKYEQSKAKAKDVHASSEDYIREHPTKCVLGAFGVGLLIGLLARRR